MTTNIELQTIVNKLNIQNFKGIYCKDELKNMKPIDTECGIINLDDSSGSGTHWTGYYRKNKSNFYFSSFGDDPPTELVNYLDTPILTHNFCIQEFDQTNCGEWVVLFLYLMSKNCVYENVILCMV